MPTLGDLARFFAALPTVETLLGLAFTAAILVLVSDWRLALLTLAVQYVLVGVLLSTVVRLEIALVRIVEGVMAASILYLAARRAARMSRNMRRSARPPAFLISWPFRAVSLVMVAATVVTLATQITFFNTPTLFWLLGLWLMGAGILIAVLTRDVITLGLGLLTFTGGFSSLYLLIDPGLPVYGFLNVLDLLIALGVAHLAAVREPERPRRRQGET